MKKRLVKEKHKNTDEKLFHVESKNNVINIKDTTKEESKDDLL